MVSLFESNAPDSDRVKASPPEWVQVLPVSTFYGRDGRGPYLIDSPVAVMTRTLEYHGQADVVIDYEHQSVNSPKNGLPAPAAGWVTAWDAREDGLWVRVNWTPLATHRLEQKEYRYLSPVFTHSPDGSVQVVISIGLTNTPNLTLTALCRQTPSTTVPPLTKDMSMSSSPSLSLPPDALLRLRQALALPENFSAEDLLVAFQELQQHNTKLQKKISTETVPLDEFSKLQAELASLRNETTENAIHLAVNSAMIAGKLPPSLKEWAETFAKSDLRGFQNWSAAAPSLAGTTLSELAIHRNASNTAATERSHEEQHVRFLFGLDAS